MTRLAVAVFVAALAFAPAACGPREGASADDRLLLSATGEVTAAPDMARVTAGVTAEAPTAAAAMAAQRTSMTAMMAALTEAGIGSSDIQTTSLELFPVYAPYDPERGEAGNRIVGYRAANRVTVTARDLTLVGPMLDALVEAGATDISNISFDVEDRDALLDAARRDAVARLKSRAALYTDAAGVRLGRIVEMSETTFAPPMPYMEMARLSADAATPVAGGELTLQVTVNAMFEIRN
jgi:uncharacterized protein YggE